PLPVENDGDRRQIGDAGRTRAEEAGAALVLRDVLGAQPRHDRSRLRADLAIRRHRSRLVLRSLDADREARAARRQINMMSHLLDRLARLLQNGLRPAIVLRLTGVPRQLRSL